MPTDRSKRAVSCWIDTDTDTEYPAICFDTDRGETLVVELDPSAAVDLHDAVIEAGVVRPRQYDHSGREPEDTEDAEEVLRDALGEEVE